MANWRDTILENFKPRISRLTLVADPDGLLAEEGMVSAIQDRGFDLIAFDDAIAFRFAYESQYRSKWDQGHSTDLVVVLRSPDQQLNKLPFDLLKAGRTLTFALHRLFPKLNYPVIVRLDRAYLDAVHDAYQKHDGEQLTERETKNFALMHCFGIVPKLIKKPVDLLKMLLSLHSRKVQLPDLLVAHILESLPDDAAFNAWPLVDILLSHEKLLRFLQDQWTLFLASQSDQLPPGDVPFSHEDVRAYIDTLFLDGSLKPVEWDRAAHLPAWTQIGIAHDPSADAVRRFRKLLLKFQAELPGTEVSNREWQQAAQRWAELIVLRWEWDKALDAADRTAWSESQAAVEDAFGKWMLLRYGTLHNLAYHQQPVMVHQISRFIAAERKRKRHQKIALLVLDGLALDQWHLLRESLESSDRMWRFQEAAAFAWVPTLTSVTRQAIFAGEPPLYFPDSLTTTSKEKTHWLRFWEEQGVPRASVDLLTSLSGHEDEALEASFGNPRLCVLGIVWNKIDEIMHGMQMQTAGMHDQVRLWASQGHLQKLLARLHGNGFTVYLTADHGNVMAKGIGKPNEGVLVHTKGTRARMYDRREFLDDTAAKFPGSIRWPNPGLPPGRHVLLSGQLDAFAESGSSVVSHGGIALEEVVVPFIAISREES